MRTHAGIDLELLTNGAASPTNSEAPFAPTHSLAAPAPSTTSDAAQKQDAQQQQQQQVQSPAPPGAAQPQPPPAAAASGAGGDAAAAEASPGDPAASAAPAGGSQQQQQQQPQPQPSSTAAAGGVTASGRPRRAVRAPQRLINTAAAIERDDHDMVRCGGYPAGPPGSGVPGAQPFRIEVTPL
jgi:hypothetical protein